MSSSSSSSSDSSSSGSASPSSTCSSPSSPNRGCPGPKKVHWGSIESVTFSQRTAPNCLHSSERPLPDKSASYSSSIIKPSTDLDHEIMVQNLWNMVTMAEERLQFYYEFPGFSTTGQFYPADVSLADAIYYEDRLIKQISKEMAREVNPRTGIKLRFKIGKPGKAGKRLKRKRE